MVHGARRAGWRAVLANRAFAALWAGQTISNFGDALYDVALLWYVLNRTGSALAAGGIAVAAGGGRILGSLIAGLVLDRVPARRVMLAADGLRCAATGAIGLAWLLGTSPGLAVLYTLACANAIGFALFYPARAAAVPRIVAGDLLVTANALDKLAQSLTSTLAWALSGAIVAVLGPARGLLLDAGTFLASYLAVRAAGGAGDGAGAPGTGQSLGELLAVVRWMRGSPPARLVFGAQVIMALAGGCFFAAIAPFLRQHLHGGAEVYGVQGAVFGCGMILGSWAIGRSAPRRLGLLYALGAATNGLGNCGFALSSSLITLLPAVFVAGLGAAGLNIGEITLMQAYVPGELRGRVFALTALVATGVVMLAIALGGWLTDRADTRWVLLVPSLVHVGLGGALGLARAVRAVRAGA